MIEREPWLLEHVDERKSVTELEILHGVLSKPETAGHAFFYFRNPDYLEQTFPEKEKEFFTEDPWSATKLRSLKERIRQNGFPVRENYANPKALGELVLKDFTEVIDTLYLADAEPAPLDREALDHEAFAQSRVRVGGE